MFRKPEGNHRNPCNSLGGPEEFLWGPKESFGIPMESAGTPCAIQRNLSERNVLESVWVSEESLPDP